MESYNMQLSSNEFLDDDGKNEPLTYLDPEFFAGPKTQTGEGSGTSSGIDIDGEFICVICTGVVLEPVECKTCSSLYCKGCLTKPDMECPKRCGGAEYGRVNRMIMNTLNKQPFRC